MKIYLTITDDMGLDAACVLLVCDQNLIQPGNSLINCTQAVCIVPSVTIDARTLAPHSGGTAQGSLSQEMCPCCHRHAANPEIFLVPCVFWLSVCKRTVVLAVFGVVL